MLLGKHVVLLAIAFLSLEPAGANPTGLPSRGIEGSNRLQRGSLLHIPTLRVHLNTTPPDPSISIPPPRLYPVHCFSPESARLLRPESEDCRIIINYIILGYPSPMSKITFGYTDAVDFDLRDPANEKWNYQSCVIFLRSINKRITDRFRMVDVAMAAERVVSRCIDGQKVNREGLSDVGSGEDMFFVAVGGGMGNHRVRGGGMGVKGS